MGGGASGVIRVLCVDDDPDFADVTAQMLALRDERIDATAVDSATAGLDALDADTYDCIVSDYDMPEMDGLAFLAAVREEYPDLPFVLFTGKGSEEIASEAIRAGAADYIQKGAGREKFDLLTQRVENAAERARNRRQRRIAERRYQQLFEQSVVGIGLSQDGVFQSANGRLAELFGYDRSDLVGKPVRDVIAPADRDVVERALGRRERGEVDSIHYVVTAVRADGERMEVEVHGGRITYDGEPAVLGIVVPVGDRTYVESPSGSAQIVTPDHAEAVGESQEDTDADDSVIGDAADPPDDTLGVDPPVQGVASLRRACEEARAVVDPEAETTLTITEDASYDVEQSVLTETVQCLLEAGVGEDPTGVQFDADPTENGFRVRVQSPTLDSRLDSDLVDGLGSRPPPITDVAKRRYWAVYSTSAGDDTVEYEVEGPSRLSTATD